MRSSVAHEQHISDFSAEKLPAYLGSVLIRCALEDKNHAGPSTYSTGLSAVQIWEAPQAVLGWSNTKRKRLRWHSHLQGFNSPRIFTVAAQVSCKP